MRLQGEHPMGPTVTPPPSQGRVPSLPILELAGELDLAVAPQLPEQLDELFAGGATSIQRDINSATFLDSTALGVFVNGLNRYQELGGTLHLVVSEPQILRVLAIPGLSH